MNNEDGVNAGARNIGRFFLSMIPWALGIGITAWLSAWISVEHYKSDLAQQRRAATYVGADVLPQSPIVIQVVPHDCTLVYKADLQGENLLLYAVNRCHENINYLAWHWSTHSPDETAVGNGYTNLCAVPTGYGDRAECKLKIDQDDRTATVRVWTSKAP